MLRQRAKTTMYRLAVWEPLFGFVRKRQLGGKTVVLMYHELAEDGDDVEAWTVVKRTDFMRQMDYLRAKFDVVSLPEAIARMARPNQVARPMAVLTFDDGDRGNREVLLPIIEALNLPVTIFVATRQVEDQRPYWFDRMVNALQVDAPVTIALPGSLPSVYAVNKTRGTQNWAQIELLLSALKRLEPTRREQLVDVIIENIGRQLPRPYTIAPLTISDVQDLAKCPLVTIGAHSHCHNILTQLDRQAVQESVAKSKQLLESWTGRKVSYFAYPNGNYNATVISAVAAAGFDAALTTTPQPWDRADPLFALPRIGIGRYDSLDVFKASLVGGIRRFLN
jgi:peptidoglycan/xylan/chitin deacetylase (PgdA/CDA1 family)